MISCRVLEHIHELIRGGEWDSSILRKDARSIFILRATEVPGLNGTLSFEPFFKIDFDVWLGVLSP